MSQPILSVETQTSIYNCLCMLLLDCFRGTKYSMYKNHAPPPQPCFFVNFTIHQSVSTSSKANFSFKPTLSNNHVQSILFSEAQLETISFFLPNLLSPLDPNNPSLSTASCSQFYPYEIHSLPLTLTSSQTEWIYQNANVIILLSYLNPISLSPINIRINPNSLTRLIKPFVTWHSLILWLPTLPSSCL